MATKNTTTARGQKPAAQKPVGGTPQALVVAPKRLGFRRAGYAFGAAETVIPLADLTDQQYQILTNEPMLVTFLVDLPDAPAAA